MFGNSVSSGMGTVILLTVASLALSFAGMATLRNGVGAVAVWCFWGIGIAQLVYVVPLYIRWKNTKPASAKGLIIGASIVALLNASCWGAFEAILR